MHYTVVLTEEKEGGYSVQCLEIPGAISQGGTKKEALKNIKEAIELMLEEDKEKVYHKIKIVKMEVSA